MLKLIRSLLFRETSSEDPLAPWSPVERRIKRPSEESYEAVLLEEECHRRPDTDPCHYVSDSYTDPSCRGGPLGAENEMPDGGDSTRMMSKGPPSKSPLPIRAPCEPLCKNEDSRGAPAAAVDSVDPGV